LTGDWKGYALRSSLYSVFQSTGFAPTRLLGAALYTVPGLEGFRTISAKMSTHMNLGVFPDKLQAASLIRFVDPTNNQIHTIP
jgi:hypothetical protein